MRLFEVTATRTDPVCATAAGPENIASAAIATTMQPFHTHLNDIGSSRTGLLPVDDTRRLGTSFLSERHGLAARDAAKDKRTYQGRTARILLIENAAHDLASGVQ